MFFPTLYQLSDVSLQLIFTDGEEAFRSWTSTDSIYGARRLARDMNERNGLLSVNGKTGLEAMEAFVLLDLIGASRPQFRNYFQETDNLFQKLVKIGKMSIISGTYLISPLSLSPLSGG